MKKSVVKMFESKESILKCGNHGCKVWPRPMDILICSDKTLESEHFTATREMRYFGSTICAINDENKTFRLSHAGVYKADDATGEPIEGEWPKTTTQTLMMYRDLCTTEGYTEIEPIEGRPGRDWRKHQEEYEARKAMIAAGIVPPRKVRRKKGKMTPELLAMLQKEYGLDPAEVMEKMQAMDVPAPAPTSPNLPMCLPVYQMTAEQVHEYFNRRNIERIPYAIAIEGTVQAIFRWEFEYLKHHDHAEADWWEKNLPTEEPKVTVIDAEYIEKLQEEKAKKPAKKATAKKTTAKKTTAKKTTKKATKKATKKEVA